MGYDVGDKVLIKQVIIEDYEEQLEPYLGSVIGISGVLWGDKFCITQDASVIFIKSDFVGKVYKDKNKLIEEECV